MKRYKLLKDYHSPTDTIYKGTVKSDVEWAKIFHCEIDIIYLTDDWFEEFSVIDVDSLTQKMIDPNKEIPEPFIRHCIYATLEAVKDAINNSPELNTDYYMEQNFFEEGKIEDAVYKSIYSTHIHSKNDIIEIIEKAIK